MISARVIVIASTATLSPGLNPAFPLLVYIAPRRHLDRGIIWSSSGIQILAVKFLAIELVSLVLAGPAPYLADHLLVDYKDFASVGVGIEFGDNCIALIPAVGTEPDFIPRSQFLNLTNPY
jgi:hypothetical protein